MRNACLIVGFMMFIATARSAAFDRRLVQAGYPRLALMMAAVAAVVYATAWMQLYWQPRQLILLAVSLFLVALSCGGVGIMFAAVLHSELAHDVPANHDQLHRSWPAEPDR
jgi:ABC-2 type transport system permease protein